MATQPKKKKKITAPIKKKPVPRKKKKKKSRKLRTFLLFLLSMTLLAFMGLAYYFTLGEKKVEPKKEKKEEKKQYTTKALLDDLSKLKTKNPVEEKEVVKRKTKKEVIKVPFQERGKIEKKVPTILIGHKPLLAIIIDDVHTKKQINAIKNLNMKVTPSIFPPYSLSKRSHLLANEVQNSMIHLPMESGSKALNKQSKTLMTSFSDEQIADRVMELRMLFPHAKYVNNHTGSVFTSDYKAMKKLYIALRMEGFVFVDSMTVASSKVGKITGELGGKYMKRDIFIDNIHTVSSIHKQLQKAVKKAKKRGYAVAIGHPHKVTLKALASAQDILQDVELVYIDDMYRRK